MTALGGLGHTLPYLIFDFRTATTIAIAVVLVELAAIAWIRNRYMEETVRFGAEQPRVRRSLQWFTAITALKALLLEGLEVVFIVIAVGAGRGLLLPGQPWCTRRLCRGSGCRSRRPSATIASAGEFSQVRCGVMLSAFGVFWRVKGSGSPGSDRIRRCSCSPRCSLPPASSRRPSPEGSAWSSLNAQLKELAGELVGISLARNGSRWRFSRLLVRRDA
jgi:hypothetical protein